MTFEQFKESANNIAVEANVLGSHHNYFLLHSTRLYKTHQWFDTFNRKLGKTIEIGPLYSYSPFLLKNNTESYDILEGDEPGVYPLLKIYPKYHIPVNIIDLGLVFGNPLNSERKLPYNDEQFDTIICWETMEHFNFNPVPFIRELNRIAKPGASILLTVPNRASADSLYNLITGRGQIEHIEEFFKLANYEAETHHTCFAFHWHEYTMREFKYLLTKSGFGVKKAGYLMGFQDKHQLSFSRRIFRWLLKLGSIITPSLGNHICVECTKQ